MPLLSAKRAPTSNSADGSPLAAARRNDSGPTVAAGMSSGIDFETPLEVPTGSCSASVAPVVSPSVGTIDAGTTAGLLALAAASPISPDSAAMAWWRLANCRSDWVTGRPVSTATPSNGSVVAPSGALLGTSRPSASGGVASPRRPVLSAGASPWFVWPGAALAGSPD